ncbi:MAG: TerC family protein [Nannocystaceae bacterium]
MIAVATLGTPLLWAAFLVGIIFLLLVDLGVFHRQSHTVSASEALTWSIVWVCLSLCFNGFVWWKFGRDPALEFLSAYVLEKSLSVDNLFVFIVIFRYMDVRPQVMHRVLFAGIVGALVLRGLFIVAGLELIGRFEWLLYLFGGFLMLTGVKLLFASEEQVDPSGNLAYRLARKVLPLTRRYVGARFFVRQDGRLRATPLFIVLMMIETSDVVFALDSIPAVFGVSRDPFIVFTSNVCAVLGLRAMFFLLQNFLDRFAYLKYGLGLVLSFIGAKMILAEGLFGLVEPMEVPIGLSLGIVGGLIGASMLVSLVMPPKPEREEVLEHTEAASLIADIDPHASVTASVDGSLMPRNPADDSQVMSMPPGKPGAAEPEPPT